MPRKTKASKTLVTFLLDRSSSMQSIRVPTIDAFNTYLKTLKEEGKGIEFTFLQFDTISLDKHCVAEPIASVPELTAASFVPRGSTPLIDASVKTIKAIDASLPARKDKPKIVVCIQTDGYENASTQHSWGELNALIKEKTEAGWQFNFMGAGIDAYEQGQRMGIGAGSTMSYDSADYGSTQQAFAASARNTASYSAGISANTGYTATQKRRAGDKFDPALINNQRPLARQVSALGGGLHDRRLRGGAGTGHGAFTRVSVIGSISMAQPLDLTPTATAPAVTPRPAPVPKAAVDDFTL